MLGNTKSGEPLGGASVWIEMSRRWAALGWQNDMIKTIIIVFHIFIFNAFVVCLFMIFTQKRNLEIWKCEKYEEEKSLRSLNDLEKEKERKKKAITQDQGWKLAKSCDWWDKRKRKGLSRKFIFSPLLISFSTKRGDSGHAGQNKGWSSRCR